MRYIKESTFSEKKKSTSSEISDDYINDCLIDISDLGGDIRITRTKNDFIWVNIGFAKFFDSNYMKVFGNALLICHDFMERIKSEFGLDDQAVKGMPFGSLAAEFKQHSITIRIG